MKIIPKRSQAVSVPSFALSISGMLLVAACHVGIAAVIYQGLQSIIPRWGAIPITLLCYWILRNLIVIYYRKRIRLHFWRIGEGHRATGRVVSERTRRRLNVLVRIYGDPLGAYAGQFDFIDSMDIIARPDAVDPRRQTEL